MSEKFIRFPQVMEVTGLEKSKIYLWVKKNKLPLPIKFSRKITIWKKSKLNEWINSQIKLGKNYDSCF